MSEITVADLTDKTTTGDGVFDVMMQGVQAHLIEEYASQRITGPEYSTVYLGSIQTVMNGALQLLLEKGKRSIELEILAIEKEKALIEKEAASANLILMNVQLEKTEKEVLLLDAEITKSGADKLRIDAQTTLIDQQKANAVIEGTVLNATKCKLSAEFDLIVAQTGKVGAEEGLLEQKKVTETAQTNSTGIDPESVIGKQVTLYGRQGDGFLRDAEQKAAKILADTWNVRRTTDEGTVADANNGLYDANIKRAIDKLLAGSGA